MKLTTSMDICCLRDHHWKVGDLIEIPIGLGKAEFCCVHTDSDGAFLVSEKILAYAVTADLIENLEWLTNCIPVWIREQFEYKTLLFPGYSYDECLPNTVTCYYTGEIANFWAGEGFVYDQESCKTIKLSQDDWDAYGIVPAFSIKY